LKLNPVNLKIKNKANRMTSKFPHLIFIAFLFYPFYSSGQTGTDSLHALNGNYWNGLERRYPYNDVKLDFLLTRLNEYNSLRIFTGIDFLKDCRDDLTILQEIDDNLEIEYLVNELDKFYADKQNLLVLVADAYCYLIKKSAGRSDAELLEYLNEIRVRYKK